MTAQQQNRAIFESQGWVYVPPVPKMNSFVVALENLPRWKKGRKYAYLDEVPKYTEDLNAIREVIVSRGNGKAWMRFRKEFTLILLEVVREGPEYLDGTAAWYFATASPAQLAEAYLRTLNLWTE